MMTVQAFGKTKDNWRFKKESGISRANMITLLHLNSNLQYSYLLFAAAR